MHMQTYMLPLLFASGRTNVGVLTANHRAELNVILVVASLRSICDVLS
jgi:hypothetical protein